MRISVACKLGDAVEIAAVALKKELAQKDLIHELTEGVSSEDVSTLIDDALGVATERYKLSPKGYYPFKVSSRMIQANSTSKFDPYLFLLFGSALKYGGVTTSESLLRRFRTHFEDFVCWCLRSSGYNAEILSIPRGGERGLPTSIKPALVEIASRFGEKAVLCEDRVTSDDNDLGVDVIATYPSIYGKSGRPVFLVQCATGHITELSSKLGENETVFLGVWEWGFYQKCSIRTAATPDDLLSLEPVFWDRLSKQGWILDRLRLIQLASANKSNVSVPKCLTSLWKDLVECAPKLDWRNGWRSGFYDKS